MTCWAGQILLVLRTVNRAEIAENKRLDAALEMVAAIHSQRKVKRSRAVL